MRRLLRNARLADGCHVDIEVDDGSIARITPVDIARTGPAGFAGPAGTGAATSRSDVRDDRHEQHQAGDDRHDEHQAGDDRRARGEREALEVDGLGGRLVLGAFAEPHAHLDKALTAEAVPNPSGDLAGAIAAWNHAAAQGTFGHDDTVARAVAAMTALVRNGCTAVRTHVNVGGGHNGEGSRAGSGAGAVLALKEAAAEMAGLIDVQIVALTHAPMTGSSSEARSNRAALDAAVEAGADLVGGCPHLEPDGSGCQVIDHAIEVAASAGLGIDLHMDETLDPEVFFLPDLARAVLNSGFARPVAASHCVTLGMQTPKVQGEVSALVAEAGISVLALPQTNLFLQGRHHPTATPRGLTAVAALVDAGVNLAAGADNVQDPFNLIGRSDPLETAALMVMAGHRLPDEALAMVSANARLAMGLPPVGFDVGDPADFVVTSAPSVRGAIADAPAARTVYKAGRPVAVTTVDSQILPPLRRPTTLA